MNATATTTWTTQDISPMFPDGTVGGDGADEAYSLRWVKDNEDGTFAMITTYWYAVDVRERSNSDQLADLTESYGDAEIWDVENQTEFLVCTDLEDPGGTEVTSKVDYNDEVLATYLTSLIEARQIAESNCTAELANFDRNYNWDGKS